MASFQLRTTLAITLVFVLFSFFPLDVLARGGSSSRSSSGSSHRSALSSSHSGIKCESCSRDSHGRIQRGPKAVEEFKRTHPKPPGCDHCEVDHIIPLSKGGRDDPSNMQWLPREQHRDKTHKELWER